MLEWFDGKKTIIGTVLLIGGAILTEVVMGIWGIDTAEVRNSASTANWFGLVMGGTGLTHKAVKKARKGAR